MKARFRDTSLNGACWTVIRFGRCRIVSRPTAQAPRRNRQRIRVRTLEGSTTIGHLTPPAFGTGNNSESATLRLPSLWKSSDATINFQGIMAAVPIPGDVGQPRGQESAGRHIRSRYSLRSFQTRRPAKVRPEGHVDRLSAVVSIDVRYPIRFSVQGA